MTTTLLDPIAITMETGPNSNAHLPHHDPVQGEELASDLAELGALVPLFAHEMSNLMTHLSGRAQLALMRPHDPEITRSVMRSVIDVSERATRLSALFLSKTGTDLESPLTDFDAVIDRIQHSFQLDPDASRLIQFTPSSIEQIPRVPEIVVEQILDNLIRNALRAIHEHPEPNDPSHAIGVLIKSATPPCSTWNTPAESPSEIEIHVIDTGIGMSPSQIESVLSPINSTRAARLYNERYPRHGLGMRVCLMLVESVGGAIRCESEPNRGTRMIVTLPAVNRGEDTTRRAA